MKPRPPSQRFGHFFLLLFLAASLSCRAASGLFPPSASDPTQTRLVIAAQAATATLIPPTSTATDPPAPTLTPFPSATPTATSAPTPQPTPSPVQFSVFEGLWSKIKENYLYPDFNGLDWDKVHEEYRQRIQTGLDMPGFYAAMQEMVKSLNDNHSFYLNPEETSNEDAEYAGKNDFVGIGILTVPVPERERITVVLVFPNSPAERAGLKAHDSILAIDGKPALDEKGFRRDLLVGPEGTEVELTIQTPGEAPRNIKLIRSRVTGTTPVPWSIFTSLEGKRIGYMLIPTFADETIDDQVGENLKAMASEGPLDGLILDNRQNSGGADNVARGVLSYFTHGTQGYFVDRYGDRRPLNVSGSDVMGSAKLNLVVLVGKDTASFGEIFSGILQDSGRAHLIGDVTDGNMELLWGYDFEDGSRAWIAHEAFRPVKHPQVDWEQTGIVPDQIIKSNWDEVTPQTDPAVAAALEHFDQLR